MKIKIHRPGELVTAHPMAELTWSGDFPPKGTSVTLKGFPGQMDYVSIGKWYQLSVDGYEKIAIAKAMCMSLKDGHMERKVEFNIPEGWHVKNLYGSDEEGEEPEVPTESYRRAPADLF